MLCLRANGAAVLLGERVRVDPCCCLTQWNGFRAQLGIFKVFEVAFLNESVITT